MFCVRRVLLAAVIGPPTLLWGAMMLAQEPQGAPNAHGEQPAAGAPGEANGEPGGPSNEKTRKEPATKLAPPAAAEENLAAKLVRDVYGEEYAKAKEPDSKAKFAARLLQEARATLDDPTARFVMMKVARDISVQLGDVEAALRTAEEIAEVYQVDGLKMKMEILDKAVKTARQPAQSRAIAEHALTLLDEAIRGEDFDAARQLGELAAAESHKAHDANLVAEVQSHVQDVDRLANASAKVKAANETLEKNPTDPQANLVVGKHLCFVKGDWEQGVPMLALCGDAGFKAAAEKDIAADKDSKAKLSAADAWWDLAEKEEGLMRQQMQQRAVTWYRQAQPLATGLPAVKIEKRIHEVEQAMAAASNTAAAGRDKKRRSIPGKIFACGLDSFMMCVNGQQVLQGGAEVVPKDFSFSPGDVITVMAIGSQGGKGFCCVIRFAKGAIATGPAWKGYNPASEVQWFLPGKSPQTYAVVRGDASPKQTTEPVFKLTGVAAPAIWGKGQTCYLMFVIK
jgi:hypothetical protein